MLIGIATLIIMLLGGGQDTFLLNPNLKKQVKTYVEDKDRRSEINMLIKHVGKDQKAFLKQRKKTIKKLTELNSNYNSSLNEFETLLDQYHDHRVALQHTYLDREMKIKGLIKEDEWEKIMNAVMEKPDKEKIRKHILASNNKMYDQLNKVCEKTMMNKDSLAKAKVILDQHRNVTDSFTEEFLDLGYRHLEPIRNYNATRSDFESIREQMSDSHKKYMASIIKLRFNLASLSSENEWKKISNELNSAFKKGKVGA